MKTLVFSDTHLGKYEEKKDIFLKDLVQKYDRIIINGDFWDNWGTSFKELIESDYKDLLDLLKEKETIYIYGNHDYRAENQQEFSEIFSNIYGLEYDITFGDKVFHFEHGHRYFFKTKNLLFKNYYYLIDKIPFLGPFIRLLTEQTYRVFPNKISKNKIATKRNEYVKRSKPKDVYYVMSHTHIPEIDEENKFINTGCIVGNFATYVEIDENGNAKLIEEDLKMK